MSCAIDWSTFVYRKHSKTVLYSMYDGDTLNVLRAWLIFNLTEIAACMFTCSCTVGLQLYNDSSRALSKGVRITCRKHRGRKLNHHSVEGCPVPSASESLNSVRKKLTGSLTSFQIYGTSCQGFNKPRIQSVLHMSNTIYIALFSVCKPFAKTLRTEWQKYPSIAGKPPLVGYLFDNAHSGPLTIIVLTDK